MEIYDAFVLGFFNIFTTLRISTKLFTEVFLFCGFVKGYQRIWKIDKHLQNDRLVDNLQISFLFYYNLFWKRYETLCDPTKLIILFSFSFCLIIYDFLQLICSSFYVQYHSIDVRVIFPWHKSFKNYKNKKKKKIIICNRLFARKYFLIFNNSFLYYEYRS